MKPFYYTNDNKNAIQNSSKPKLEIDVNTSPNNKVVKEISGQIPKRKPGRPKKINQPT